jgi:hypothetical protein
VVTAIARETARQQRAAEAAQQRALREAVRLERERKKEHALADKAARQRYLEARAEEVQGLNMDLAERISALDRILEHTLNVDDTISFGALRITEEFRPFRSPDELHTSLREPDRYTYVGHVVHPSGLRALVPGARKKYERQRRLAEEEYRAARARWQAAEAERTAKLQALREAYEKEKADFEHKRDQRNAEVAEFEAAYRSGDAAAIVAYHTMVL